MDRFTYDQPPAPASALATRYDQDVNRLREQVKQMEGELFGPNSLDAQIQAAGDKERAQGYDPAESKEVQALLKRKQSLADDYRQVTQALIAAQKAVADEQAKEAKRQAALANRAKKNGRVPQTETDYLSDLEDAHALGEMTDAEVTAKHNAWVRANVTAPKEAQAAALAAQNTAASQEISRGNLAVSQGNLALSRETAGRNAAIQTANLSQQETTNKINVAKEARAAGEDARKSAMESHTMKGRGAMARALASGKSPEAALAAAYADPDPDFDAAAERAAQRFLASIGMAPPAGGQTPSFNPAAAGPQAPPPVPAPVPGGGAAGIPGGGGTTQEQMALAQAQVANNPQLVSPGPMTNDPSKRDRYYYG